ncbi:MAG: 50S ribosomal protein L10 [Desulfurivibrionaceae bacterium]
MNRDEKAALVEDLSDKLKKAELAVVTEYKGLNVASLETLRRELKKNNAEFKVVKNTLLSRAVSDSAYEPLKEHLQGTTAVTVAYDDPVAVAKVLTDFNKDFSQLEIKGATVSDGNFLTLDDLTAMAKLPPRDVLLAQLMSVMQAVPTGFVRVLQGVPQKFVYALQAIQDSKEQ